MKEYAGETSLPVMDKAGCCGTVSTGKLAEPALPPQAAAVTPEFTLEPAKPGEA